MSSTTTMYVVVAVCGALALAAYVGLILIPAWNSYSRIWERLGASFLTLYVLLAAAVVGVGIGAAVVWLWDELST
jgi:hypothetical protein